MKIKKIKYGYVIVAGLSMVACLGSAGMTFYLSQFIENPNMKDFVKMSIAFVLSIMITPIISVLISSFTTKSKYEHKEILINAASEKRMLFIENEQYNNKVNFLKSNNQEREILMFVCKLSEAFASMLAMICLLALHLSWYLVVTDVLIFCIVAFFSVRPNVKLAKLMSDFWMKYIQNTRYYNYISDVLSKKEYVEEKKVYGFFDSFVNVFEFEFEKAAEINKELGKKRIRLEELNNIINSLFILFEILFLIIAYEKNLLPLGFLVAVLPFAISTYSKVCIAINGVNILGQADSFLQEESDFLELEKKVPKQFTDMEYAIKVDGVSFRYAENEKLVLDNISFKFEKKKKYAIVGVNGSGKTTFAKILSGLYEPEKGSVSAAGEVAILFQDYVKYPFTVGENIALQKEYDKGRIERILESVGLDTMLHDMKKGLDNELTNTKEEGTNISGGQWQRIALARILYLSNDIVVLDEPTASLDPKIEIEIYREYMQAFKDKTVIFITHRLGYIKDVDEVLVINEGKIIEHGAPIDLLKNQCTFFYQLFEEQRSLYEE